MNTGQILKSKTTERFTVIPNSILEDRRLSLKAIGLLCYILRLPPDWVLHKSRLHNNLKDGRDAVINAFNELESAGYIQTVEVRESGKFHGYNYFVYDVPKNKEGKNLFPGPVPGNPEPAPPITEKAEPVNPISENPELLKTDFIKNFSLFPNGNKDAPPPNGKKVDPKPKTIFQNFISKYDQWFKDYNDGTPANIDAKNGNAAKTLINYFKKIVVARAETDRVVLDEESTGVKILEAWGIVLDNWGRLEPYYQDKTRLIDINSNIQNIIKQVKNGARKPQQTGSDRGKITGSTINDIFASIDAKSNK